MIDLNKFFTDEMGAGRQDHGVSFNRTNCRPLDGTSIFEALSAAENYVATSPVSYPGQFITVVDKSTGATTGYIVGGTGNLIELGSVESTLNGMNVVVGDQKVPLTIVDNKLELSVGGGLKMENGVLTVAEISTVSDISANAASNDPAATSAIVEYTKNYVAEKATVTVEKQTTAETGYASTYVIKQGGVELGTKINIPKDFLVKSAELKECSEDGKPDKDLKVGDKYIDFVVNTTDDSETAQHVYLKVADLVDVYTGLASDTIDLSVVGTQISAYVREGSIAKKHLATDVITWGTELSDNAVVVANAYTNTTVAAVSAALSDDYVKKIGDAQTAAIAKAMEVSSAASAYTDAQIAAHDTAAKELLAQVSADAITSALISANAYTDEKIGAIDYAAFAMLSDLESLSDEVSAISTDLKGQIGQTLTDAKAYANDTSANALTDAKAYTDELCGSLSVTIDQKITDLNIDQYAISTDVKAELGAVSAETLVSAAADAAAKVADEAKDRAKAIEDLSTALSGDVKTLAEDYGKVKAEYAAVSADYKAVSADHEGRIDTLESGTSALSGRMNKVESDITSISSNYATKQYVNDQDAATLTLANKYTDDAITNIGTPLRFVGVTEDEKLSANSTISALSGIEYVGGAIKDGDVALNTKNGTEYVWNNGKWHEIGDENNHVTKAELTAEETARKAADSFLSGKIDEISTAYATKAELTAEETARKAADAVLSNAIDNKIFCGNYGNVLSAESLSVVKISQADYHNLVAEEKVDNNVVYIVNNDGAYNMYGETISELSTTGIEGTSEAANTLYVDKKVQEVSAEIPLSVSQLIWDIATISCGGANL